MSNSHDVRITGLSLYFLPVENRVPLKFGPETIYGVTCGRACVTVADRSGKTATGWGETPLSSAWVWPSNLSIKYREGVLKDFTVELARELARWDHSGHALEIGYEFQEQRLHALLEDFNRRRAPDEPMPYLGALVCCSLFDIAIHDAYGRLHGVPVYQTYTSEFMNRDLSHYLEPAEGSDVSFKGRYPGDFLLENPPAALPAWHLVGGTDPVTPEELTGKEPDDGYPVVLTEWLTQDQTKCLKIKLRGNDWDWDWERVLQVHRVAAEHGALWYTVDYNCTVQDPAYVTEMLDRLLREEPDVYARILYVEQPFPYDLENNRLDVFSVSARKPLFMDESAHDWHLVKLGRTLGWTGVALKTCKTQTGALLTACWAKAHGMTLMVQDLTNPMLAQVTHVLLAAHAGTIMGVETNSMQFYPEASSPEAQVHPGIYRRRNGQVELSTITGPGFGYNGAESVRELPKPEFEA